MALTQDDRISISKKIIDIPRENETAEGLKDQLELQRVELEKQDNGNKSLQDDQTALVNDYQAELSRYDGNGRTEVTEQDMLDSANRIIQCPFFPNDNQTSLPSIPDGVWKSFVPFAGGLGIGRDYLEAFSTVTREQDLIDDINDQIVIVEAENAATRSTGDSCVGGGTCSLPIYTNQTDCQDNGGTWTPGGPDFIGPDAQMQQAATDLKNAVQAWEDFLNGTLGVIPTDTDAGRQVENDASTTSANSAISDIDTWQALQDFDTTTSVPSTCASFNSKPAGDFTPSKFRADELQTIKDAIAAREAFFPTRTGQINGHLGTVVQDSSSGEITSATGFYGTRFRFIDMRLNGMAGSLSKLRGLERGQDAQQSLQNSNNSAGIALTTVMTASQFRAPATNTSTIHVLDGSGFSPGDSAYVTSNSQAEIPVVIQTVSGNRIVLDVNIPEKYRHTEGARLYKVL